MARAEGARSTRGVHGEHAGSTREVRAGARMGARLARKGRAESFGSTCGVADARRKIPGDFGASGAER